MITSTTQALIVNATAGSGKTTTIVDGINYAVSGSTPDNYSPSKEQRDIWEWMDDRITENSDIIMLAFNNSIANELKDKLTYGEACTLHSLGYKILRNSGVKCKLVKDFKTSNIYMRRVGAKTFKDLSKDNMIILDDLRAVVGFCKDKLMTEDDTNIESLNALCIDRGYTPATSINLLVELVAHVLEVGSEITTGVMGKVVEIDFNDMIYLPARHGLSAKFDVMMVDEAQDLSHSKLQLVLNQECNTYVFVGDPNQAIYGFAGADTQSFASIGEALPDVTILPLSYTFRCGKNIVKEAQQIVGTAINAADTNIDGEVLTIPESEMIMEEGDMLLSRVNAHLMGIAWRLIKDRKAVKVMGRDIGKGLITLINKLAGKGTKKIEDSISIVPKVEAWRTKEISILQNKPGDTDSRQIAINDQADCIVELCHECDTIEEMKQFIKDLFDDTDSNKFIRLSSIHRAKGLEADKVFFFNSDNVPHPMAKTDEAKIQESNLRFVAVTRAIKQLVYVKPEKKKAK